ncbi:MAG TPA: hypothetical protein VM674_01295 [Candidatus Acidoferrum sp.]|nr:hypothetical protein [Candidatus Acidoferrum sp.]
MADLSRPVIGWLGEHRLDGALLIPSGGRLIPWVPLIDAHGIDRAYSWDGIGAPWFVQSKASSFADAEGRYRWEFRAGTLQTQPRFRVVLSLSQTSPDMEDVVWCLDGESVHRLGRKEYDSALRTDVYRLDASPTHQDRLAPYRHRRADLWKLFAPPHQLTSAPPVMLPTLRIDQGGLYEFAIITELLKANHKDLLVFRPSLDIHGRDLLVHLVGSSLALYLQVKGTALRRHPDLVRFHLRRSTFAVADDFWVVSLFWEKRTNDFFPEGWLVSSRDLAERTAHQRDSAYITIDARLNRSADLWGDRRVQISDLANVLRASLADQRLAA